MSSTDGRTAYPKSVAPLLPIYKRVWYAVTVFILQKLILLPLLTLRNYRLDYTVRKSSPDIVKKYACRPRLPIRVFIPSSYDRTSSQRLPTVFTVHGGGFVLGCPEDNDDWNRTFCDMHSVLVVALNYAKAPTNCFPGPVHDVESLFHAALADVSLPIDPHRLAMLGFSAGGNLILATAQLPSMLHKAADGSSSSSLAALVPIYPVVDFTVSHEEKAAAGRRRYKPQLGGFRGRTRDYLTAMAERFDWAYIPAGHDLRDPLLSPVFAQAEALPKNVFMIACELDMLAHEAWRLVCRLAGREVSGKMVGREELSPPGSLILDDPRFHFEERRRGGNYKWLLVPDSVHGFDQEMDQIARDEEMTKDAKVRRGKMQRLIGDWLFAGPFLRAGEVKTPMKAV
ncbi:hypothetical protein VTK73DRAFT_4690 [Phialemonium thermophilum]|uniref:Alpha/beta hydrolase fold-3 domain-containing protein n=1 Tax=Phialemonium thermophilum TaxID=223376 RepID=A0ABR3WSQ2_9PEZI